MTTRHDVVVVGVGGMGSAACYHLARRGVDVLGLERFDVPHSRGSSHGDTRIIRLAYHEHPDYVPLLRTAYENWAALDARTDRDLLTVTGSLSMSAPGGDTAAGAREACERHGIPHETLDGAELSERIPAFDVPASFDAVYQRDGGLLRSEECVAAHVEGTFEHGGTVRARETVESWTETGDGVRVRTDGGDYEADHLVLAAGAWTGDLLPELDGHLTVERQVLRWFRPEDPAQFSPERFPVYIFDTDDREFYGFPRAGRPGVKAGIHHHFGESVDPDDRAALEPTPEDERALTAELGEYVPAAGGETLSLVPCLYTNSPDRRFVVDRASDAVTVAAGFSGHGFKFASAVGEVLADLAVDGETAHPVDLFSLDRL
jgi:sarcosine oxidase